MKRINAACFYSFFSLISSYSLDVVRKELIICGGEGGVAPALNVFKRLLYWCLIFQQIGQRIILLELLLQQLLSLYLTLCYCSVCSIPSCR